MNRTCDWIEERLDDFVDGELPESERTKVESHLESCDACRAALEELRSLLAEAAALPRRIEPARDLWTEIEPQLRGGVVRFPDWRRRLSAASYAAVIAAGVVLAVAIGLSRAPAPDNVAPQQAMPVELYETERAVLHEAYAAHVAEIDPELRHVVDTNLAIIEQSVAEIRLALAEQPADPALERMLNTAYLSEVDLLQRVVSRGVES